MISGDALEGLLRDYLGIAPLCEGIICLCAVGALTASSKGEQGRCWGIVGFYKSGATLDLDAPDARPDFRSAHHDGTRAVSAAVLLLALY